MMTRKIILNLLLALLVSTAYAQRQSGYNIGFIGGQKTVKFNATDSALVVVSGGQPIYSTTTTITPDESNVLNGFPYPATYFAQTFDQDFFVSKGYFPDVVQMNWEILTSGNNIKRFAIYRKPLGAQGDSLLVATLGPNEFSFRDEYVEGGVLYKYTLFAEGISEALRLPFVNYIEATGFAFPVGTATGRVTYSGGTAVPDVKILAETKGNLKGRSIYFDATKKAYLRYFAGKDKTEMKMVDGFTFQLWTRYESPNNDRAALLSRGSEIDLSYDGSNLKFKVGDTEALLPYANPVDSFFHVSAVYNPTDNYIAVYATTTTSTIDSVRINTGTVPAISSSDPFFFGRNKDGNYLTGYIDEMRMWSKPLDYKTINTDFSRYIAGNEDGFAAYWRLNAGLSSEFYDFSRQGGFDFNENHGKIIRADWSEVTPLQSQLAYRGVTDKDGNYTISGFPFETSGSLYTFTPIFESHSFEPIQQLRFVGDGAYIFNEVDFTDVSSFPVSGTIFYKNTPFPVEGINVLVDGITSVNSEGIPVTTNANGEFTVDVPIGFHSVRVVRPMHGFEKDGKFPPPIAGDDKTQLFNFQEPLAGLIFQDTTLVKLAGKVVGGPIEQEKLLGFGLSKNNIGNATILLRPTKLADLTFKEADSTVNILEKKIDNNVTFNIRDITIKANPETGEFAALVPPEQYSVVDVFTTNYNFDESYNTTINMIANISDREIRQDTIFAVVESDTIFASLPFEPLDYDTVFTATNVDTTFTIAVGTFDYEKRQDFIYRVSPQIEVTDIEGNEVFGDSIYVYKDDNLGIEQALKLIDRSNTDNIYLLGHPTYVQRNTYSMKARLFEEYIDESGSLNQVPVVDGEVAFINDMAINKNEVRLPLNRRGEAIYTFTAGLPNIALDELTPTNSYTKTLSLTAFSGNNSAIQTIWRESDPYRGIVLGGLPTGNNFVTNGPNEIITILRDPPGTASYSFIEEGTTVTKASSWNMGASLGASLDVTASIGTSVTQFQGAGIGAFSGTINESSSVVDVSVGLSSEVSYATENTAVNATTFNRTISTSDSPDFVGVDGDIFVGYSTNIVYGKSRNLELVPDADCVDDNCLDVNIPGYKLGLNDGIRLNPEFETFFLLSQFTIEAITIPSIANIRNSFLTYSSQPDTINPISAPVYVSLIPADDERFGSDNYDKEVWGNEATEKIGVGPSYVIRLPQSIIDNTTAVNDTVFYFNQQVREWKYWLAHNERVKINAKPERNVTFDGGVVLEESEENSFEDEFTREFNVVLGASAGIATDVDASIFGVAVGFDISASLSAETSGGTTTTVTEETTTTYGFVLDDGDLGDTYTVDIKEAGDGFGPVFATIGGATSCPYEDAVLTKYYKPGEQLSAATAQREVPDIGVDQNVVTEVPSNRQAVYTLFLRNNSETGDGFEMELDAVDGTNPFGAILEIDGAPLGNGLVFNVPAGQTLTKTLTLSKGQEDITNYEGIGIQLRSLCQADPNDNRVDIADEIFISAFFQPGCSDIAMTVPVDQWVLNSRAAIEGVLSVNIADYDLNLDNFERVDFQYKPASSSQWITDMKFYNTQQVTQAQFDALDDPKQFIDGSNINYDFDLNSLPDREYDVRAVSRCVLGPGDEVFTPSDIMRGNKDTKRPQLFGAPQPADGILSANDEIKIQFDETIEAALVNNSSLSIKGVLNNTELANGVSVSFDGINDYVKIPAGLDLSGRSFTTFSWLRRNTYNQEYILYSKGNNENDVFEYGYTANNKFYVNVSGQIMETSVSFSDPGNVSFEYIAVVYDNIANTVTVYRNGAYILENFPVENSFSGTGSIALGRSEITKDKHFNGNMHELRIWTDAKSLSDIASRANLSLIGNEVGLAGYWPMDEAFGDISLDKARFRNAIVFADWTVEPKGNAFDFDGVDDYVELSTGSTVTVSDVTDFTIEFWFKGTPGQGESVMFSNGKGDGTIEAAASLDTWFIGFNKDNKLVVSNNLTEILVNDSENKFLDDNWHHLAMSVSRRGNLNVVIDLEQQVSVSSSGLGGLFGSRMWIGARGYRETNITAGFDRYFKGSIDEFRIWNSFKRKSQIELNWNSKLIGDEVGLVAYYPFEVFELVNGINIQKSTLADQFINEFGDNGGLAVAAGGSDFDGDDTPRIKLARPVQSVDFEYAINDDAIILSLSPNFAALVEQTVLEISVRTVEDLFENRLASPVSWTAFVDRNQIKWGDDRLAFTKDVNEPLNFTIDVTNYGGTEQTFSIDNLPAWLTASPQSGSISPQTTIAVQFEVNPGLNIGSYEEDIFLSADLGFNEKLNFSIDVFGNRPDWNVNPSDYQFSMNVVGELKISGVTSTDENDLVSVFVNDTLRGVGNLNYVRDLDRYLVFLDIYANVSGGEALDLRVWDASTGIEHRDVAPQLTFTSNEIIGSATAPAQIIAGAIVLQDIPLSGGWNWVSFSVNSPSLNDINGMMKNLNAVNGDQIKGQTAVDIYTEGFGWKGSITNNGGAEIGNMYQIKINQGGNINLIGSKVSPDTEIPILTGWNWIGYIPTFNISVEEAFNSITPSQGDVVKSQFAFAIYDDGIGWEGTLKFMEDAKGYLYLSDKDATLVYPATSILNSRVESNIEQNSIWSSTATKYASNMTIIAQIPNYDASSIVVGAFQDNQFRGGVEAIRIKESDYFFLTIGGDVNGETLTFKAYDKENDELWNFQSTISYQVNQTLGNLAKPVKLELDEAVTSLDQLVSIYPNPSTEGFNISLINVGDDVKVEIVDVQGRFIERLVLDNDDNNGTIKWNADVQPGMYLIKIISNEMNQVLRVIKK